MLLMGTVDLKRDVISVLGGMLVDVYVFHHIFFFPLLAS